MLAENIGMDIFGVYAQMRAEDLVQACRIKQRAGAKHTVFRQACHFVNRIGNDIDRVADNNINCIRSIFDCLRHYALDDVHIALGKVNTGLAGLACAAQCYNHDIGALYVGIVSGVNIHGRTQGCALDNIHRFAFCLVLVDIH